MVRACVCAGVHAYKGLLIKARTYEGKHEGVHITAWPYISARTRMQDTAAHVLIAA